MNILNRKVCAMTFFRIKTDRYSLNGTNIVYRGTLFKIGQRNMTLGLVNFYRFNRRRDFLNSANPDCLYFSLVRFISSSSPDPLSPLEFHVAMFIHPVA